MCKTFYQLRPWAKNTLKIKSAVENWSIKLMGWAMIQSSLSPSVNSEEEVIFLNWFEKTSNISDKTLNHD